MQAPPCPHQAPPELRELEQAGARLPDVCHRAHLYTVALGPLEVRLTVDGAGRTTCMARLAGLPNKVVGLWWPARAWAALALLEPPATGGEAAWFVRHRGDVGDTIAAVGIDTAERRLAALAR